MSRLALLALVSLFLGSCEAPPEEPKITDEDGDGYAAEEDCDDADAEIHPDANERCNDLDDDCDTEVDEELAHTFYADADGDSYGDPNNVVEDCAQPENTTTNSDDCDDAVITNNPGAAEVCDGMDNNCDSVVDEGVTTTLYVDADGDGHGDINQPVEACPGAAGYTEVADDCDDTNPAVNPGVVESDCTDLNDYNCDGISPFQDADGDGWTECQDCNDESLDISPDAIETCNDLDDDCDDTIDEEGAEGGTSWYLDYDGDGYGDGSASVTACDQPAGYVSVGGDCDDNHRGVNPGTPEICDRFDDDCDGLIDENGC